MPGNYFTKIETVFGRRLLGNLLTINLSTIIIIIVGQSTMYLDGEKYFEMIVATNITCLTVLASLFIFITTTIPTTSYLKMMDLWFIFNLYYPCGLIIINIFIQKSKEEEEQRINSVAIYSEDTQTKTRCLFSCKKSTVAIFVGRIFFPVSGSFFVISYFLVGLYYYTF